MKTDDQIIREIAEELCIDEGQVMTLWREAFSSPRSLNDQWGCDTRDVKSNKTLTKKVLDRLAKEGRLEIHTVYCAKTPIRGYEVSEYSLSNKVLNPPTLSKERVSPPTWDDLFDDSVLPEPRPVGRYTAQGAAFERGQRAKREAEAYVLRSAAGDRLWTCLALEPAMEEATPLTQQQRFWHPMMDIEKDFGGDIFRRAVEKSLALGKGHPGYVRRVAEGVAAEAKRAEAPRPVLSGERRTFTLEDGRECGEYDTWCLDHPRYRERYIATFGEPDA